MSAPARQAPLLLALETSSAAGSVALGRGGRILASRALTEQRRHAARLPGAMSEVLDEAGVGRSELDGVVVGAGPGSFTGVRVAAATAKGLAHALRIPLYALSSLRAAALADGGTPRGARYVLFDARADRVYAACYLPPADASDAGVIEIVAPHATRVGDVLDGGPPDATFYFVGAGARRHRKRIEDAGYRVLDAPAGDPTASALLELLALDPHPPVEDPASWQPDYLRASSAERP